MRKLLISSVAALALAAAPIAATAFAQSATTGPDTVGNVNTTTPGHASGASNTSSNMSGSGQPTATNPPTPLGNTANPSPSHASGASNSSNAGMDSNGNRVGSGPNTLGNTNNPSASHASGNTNGHMTKGMQNPVTGQIRGEHNRPHAAQRQQEQDQGQSLSLRYPVCSASVTNNCIELGKSKANDQALDQAYPNCAGVGNAHEKAACIETAYNQQNH